MSEQTTEQTPQTGATQTQSPSSPPYDALHKDLFSHKALLLSFLRAFVEQSFVGRLKVETLRLVSGEFVDEDLHRSQSDTLWQAELTGGTRPCYVVLLLEFQRRPERLMAFRILRYVVRILSRWQREREEAHRQLNEQRRLEGLPPLPMPVEPFPLIFPMVIYNGTGKWTARRNMNQLFGVVADDVLRHLPSLEYALFDIRRLRWQRPELASSLAAQWVHFVQARTKEDGIAAVAALRRILRSPEYRDLKELSDTILRWISLCLREAKMSWQWVEQIWNEPDLEDEPAMLATMMDLWDKEEHAEARAEARAEALAEEKQNTATRMLAAGRLSLEEIAAYADLDLEDVRALAAAQQPQPQ